MSFGSPTSDVDHGEYLAVFEHANGQLIEIRSRLTPGPGTLDPTDMDAAWAAAVALVDGDSDFTFSFGQKSYTTTEGYSV